MSTNKFDHTGQGRAKKTARRAINPLTRGGRTRKMDERGGRDAVSHRRRPDRGTPELQVKRAALVAGACYSDAVLFEAVNFLREQRPQFKKELAQNLSPAARALLNQKADETLSVHPLGVIHARRLTTCEGAIVVSPEGLVASVRYADLHHRVFASRRTQTSAFFRLYVSGIMPTDGDMTDADSRRMINTEARLSRAESALRDIGVLSRRLVRNMALFDQWPDFLTMGKRRGLLNPQAHEAQLVEVKRGIDALQDVLLKGAKVKPATVVGV